MRILYPFIGDSLGGNHISTLNLARNMRANRHEVTILVHEHGLLTKYLDYHQIPYEVATLHKYQKYTPSIIKNMQNLFYTFKDLRRILKKYKPDIVHGNDFRTNILWCPVIVFSRKIIYIWHQRSIAQRKPFFWWCVLLLSNKVIAISRAVIEPLPAWQQQKMEVIYNPVGLSDISSGNYQSSPALNTSILQRNFQRKEIKLGYIGRFVSWKNPDQLIDISHVLAKKYGFRAICLFAGNISCGYHRLIKTKATQLGLENCVSILDFQNAPAHFYKSIDVLVCPSNPEPFGRTLVEAMLSGTPVVAANCSGHTEIITDGSDGLLATPNDYNSFAEKIMDLSDHRLTTQIVHRGAISARQFSEKKHYVNINNTYKSLINNRH